MRLVALLAVAMGSCAHPYDAARRVVIVADKIVVAGTDEFVVYDRTHQIELAEKGDAEGIKAWREKRKAFVETIDNLRGALILAPVLVDMAERGLKKDTEVDRLLADIWTMLQKLRSLAQDMNVKIPLSWEEEVAP